LQAISKAVMKRADEKRFARTLVLVIGRLGLVFSLVFLGTSHWFGLPSTTTPLQLILFGVVGLVLALAGYRMRSGSLAGFSKVLHQSAAIAGLLFLAVCLRRELNVNRQPLPPGWVVVVAALAPVSWWLVTFGMRRHSGKQLRS
jgi:hypothetical protein